MNSLLTRFEEKAVNEIAVSMFDHGATSQELEERIEEVAGLLGCSVAHLVSGYVRGALAIVAQAPRNHTVLGDLEFELGWAREALSEQLSQSSAIRRPF